MRKGQGRARLRLQTRSLISIGPDFTRARSFCVCARLNGFYASMSISVLPRAFGEVIRSGHTGERGNFVELRHADDSETRYFNVQDQPTLTQGDTVSAGDTLGNVGATERVTGPNLHNKFERTSALLIRIGIR